MPRTLFSRLALGAGVLFMANPLFADVNIAGLHGTGTYVLDGKDPVNHKIDMGFNNDGIYRPNPFKFGRIYEVVSPCPANLGDVCGKWQFGGKQGTFAWSNPSGDGLSFIGNFKIIEGSFNDAQAQDPENPTAIYFPPNGTWNVQFQR